MEEPPYTLSVSGYGSFELRIHIHFNNKEVATLKPFIHLYDDGEVSMALSKVFTFSKPNKEFRKKLLLAGGRPCKFSPASKGETGSQPVSKGESDSPRKRKRKGDQHMSRKKRKLREKLAVQTKGKKRKVQIIMSSDDEITHSEDTSDD